MSDILKENMNFSCFKFKIAQERNFIFSICKCYQQSNPVKFYEKFKSLMNYIYIYNLSTDFQAKLILIEFIKI